MMMVNPDPTQWTTTREAFNEIGRHLCGAEWDGREVEQVDRDNPEEGLGIQDYVEAGYSVPIVGETEPGDPLVEGARHHRAARAVEELRRLLHRGALKYLLYDRYSRPRRIDPPELFLSRSLVIWVGDGGVTLHGSANSAAETGCLFIGRAELERALAPGGTQAFRKWFEIQVKNDERVRKPQFLDVAKDFRVREAAALRIWGKCAPEHWKKQGRPKSDTE
jgi:hypothetical protein